MRVGSLSLGVRKVGEDVEDVEDVGRERLKRRVGGLKRERVPVPVRSGRYSPWERMLWIRERYWCSSWVGLEGVSVGIGRAWGGGREAERGTPASRWDGTEGVSVLVV